MEKTYYIPIKSVNLAHYLSSGIIAPSKYFDNRNPDIQDFFNNYILISTLKFTIETNCAIEIVLNSIEEAPSKISENFFLFDMPLPISRIKGIYFNNEEQKVNTEFNILSGAAFIPKTFLKFSNDESNSLDEISDVPFKPTQVDWSHFLKKYDQLMGGFATMKISKENFQNYPTHYFKSLGNINGLFNEILLNQNIEVSNNFEFAFTNNGKFKDFNETIYSEIDNSVVQKYAEKDDLKLETRNGLIQIDKISENKPTYLIAILESYGQGKRKQVDSFISDLISGKFNEKKKEGLALIFGLNKGYKGFRNKYKTDNFETEIKFKLDSQLDYYIIESIYQNVFNSLNNIRSFEYIDNWCVKNEFDKADYTNFYTYEVLDKTIILKKKQDFFNELFHSSLEKRNKIYVSVIQKISSWFPKFVKVDADELNTYLKTELESSFNEYTNYIYNKTKAEFEVNNEVLKQLNQSAREKDEEIKSLKIQIQDLYQIKKQENTINLDSAPIENENEKSSESIIKELNIEQENNVGLQIKKNTNTKSEELDNQKIEENTVGSLFSNEPEIPNKQVREKELNKYSVNDLKTIAGNLNIPNYKSLKKPSLILEILNNEFK